MINISYKQRNNAALSMMNLAMTKALEAIGTNCININDLPGFDVQCDNCVAKQGCRDVSRAAVYTRAEFLKRMRGD